MVTDQSPSSPTASAASNGGVNSPDSRRKNRKSRWSSVVRGDTEKISSPPPAPEQVSVSDVSIAEVTVAVFEGESSDVNGEGNAGRLRRSAWNTPLNDVVEVGPVMGEDISWPALSESTRPVPKSTYDSPRPVSDGSVSLSQAPLISHPPQRQANTNTNTNTLTNSTPNNTTVTKSRPRNRVGGNSSVRGPSQNNFIRPSPPTPPPFPVCEANVRGNRPVQGVVGNDHSAQRNNSRRGNNSGPRPQYPPPPPPMGYIPTLLPPGAVPFMGPPPVRIFPGQMGFDMGSPFMYVPTMHPESFRAMPIVPPPPPPPPPMLFPPANDNHLSNLIVRQINFYFSDANLVKDGFLRSNMDDNGWVPITLIASFRRVQLLTQDVQVILESLRNSTVVEVQGDNVRRRNDWSKWLARRPENVTGTSFQGISLDDAITNSNGNIDAVRLLTEELTNGLGTTEEVHSITA